MPDFKYGDVLRLSDTHLVGIPTAYRDRRVMYVSGSQKNTKAILIKVDPHETIADEEDIGKLVRISGQVWQVVDDAE